MVCGVRMGVAGGGVGTRGEGVVSRGGNVSVADGGGARCSPLTPYIHSASTQIRIWNPVGDL